METIKLKMSHDNIAKEQRKEFKSIYNWGFLFCKRPLHHSRGYPSLRTTFSDDPHIILKDRPTTVVVRRLADSLKMEDHSLVHPVG